MPEKIACLRQSPGIEAAAAPMQATKAISEGILLISKLKDKEPANTVGSEQSILGGMASDMWVGEKR